MTRAITIAGFVVLFVAGAVLELLARRPGSPVPRPGAVVGQAMRQRTGRVVVFIMWFWFGWHFIAR